MEPDGECHFCHGLVVPEESEHVVLDGHGDHAVFVHYECAAGHDAVESIDDGSGDEAIRCPQCGAVEAL